jgi:hypothetical protein
MITVNFEDTYDPTNISDDLSRMTFVSPLTNGILQELLVKISPHPDPFLPNVFNLGFGPPGGPNDFLDNVRLKHANVSKVFSTVLFHGLIFLQSYPELTIGIDGSDDKRATMYHLMVKSNRTYLEDFFLLIGVDWYVRVFRNWALEEDDEGNLLSKPRPELFDYDRQRHDLYRYYMFRLR